MTIALVVLLAAASLAAAAPLRGQLDPSFGHDGRVLFGHGSSFAKARYEAVAVQPDGAAVLAGHTESIRGKFVERTGLIQRRLPDGRLDPGFQQVASGGGGFAPTALALQADGDVLYAAGGEYTGAVERLLPDGKPDTSFGNDGTAEVPLAPYNLAVDSEGRVLVAGGAPIGGNCHDCVPQPAMAVARLNSDGTLDRSFGTDGMWIVNSPHSVYGFGLGLALEPDGSIVIRGGGKLFGVTAGGATNLAFGDGGEVAVGSGFGAMTESAGGDVITAGGSAGSCCRLRGRFVLHAFRADGSLDPAWGTGGTLTIRAGDVVDPVALAPGADGSVTLLGETAKATEPGGCKECEFRPFVARIDAAGGVDPSFSNDLRGPLDGGSVAIAAIAVAPDGAVVGAGSSKMPAEGEEATAIGLTPRGRLDLSYGRGGFASRREPLPSNTVALGFAAGPGKKLVAAYETDAGGSSDRLSIGAWSQNGKRIHGYGGRSRLVYSQPNLTLSADDRGRLYRIETNSDSVRRLGTDGRLERRYGLAGRAPLPEGFDARRLAVSPDGAALAVGRIAGEDEMTLYELSPTGHPDRKFGDDGLVRIRSPKGLKARALAATFDRQGRILVFGTIEQRTPLIRLLPNGHPDPSFGDHGRVNFQPVLSTKITSVTATRDGRIYLVTSSSGGRETTLARFREDGTLDRSFGRGGVVQYQASQPLLAFFPGPRQLVLVAGDGAAFRTGFTLRAFHLDGSRDRSFGDRGVFRGSPGPLGAFGPIGAVRQPDGKIVIAGTRRPRSYGEKLELIRFR
ncbi:MAG: hypothetical protein JST59_26460 [Actinobacteria bacterium]|nr:hypothetical protein [Actinomycetota bacterium]